MLLQFQGGGLCGRRCVWVCLQGRRAVWQCGKLGLEKWKRGEKWEGQVLKNGVGIRDVVVCHFNGKARCTVAHTALATLHL